MVVLIKLFYAGAITALLILLVAFGIRTFYPPPEQPEYPRPPGSLRPFSPGPETVPVVAPTPTPEQLKFESDQQRYQDEFDAYVAVRASYRRNVFLAASIIGVVAVAAGVSLATRVDAIRLGLVAGGLGCVLYAVIQSGGDLVRAGPAVVFVATSIGLALIVASGYRWLSKQDA